jgi:uncharacterized membrane protein
MSDKSETSRIEAFCDGVFAIAITILILEIKIPPLHSIHSAGELTMALLENWPSWFGFLLSFIIILIAWVNHHGTFKNVVKSTPQFIYANGFLLLTVAVIPFSTALMAEYLNTEFAQPAVTFYCFVILVHNTSWILMGYTLMHPHPLIQDEESVKLVVTNITRNAQMAFFVYLTICILSFWFPVIAMVLITTSWILWLVTSIALTPR